MEVSKTDQILSDPHRFGQTVTFVERPSGAFFLKPRNCELEFHLFCPGGHLYSFVRECLRFESPLEVDILGDWSGASKSLRSLSLSVSNQEQSESEDFSRRAGALLALCTCFGLTDLHADNILTCRLADGTLAPVPIDVEVAFWNSVSGMDTLLFPSRIISPERAGFAAQFRSRYKPERPDLFLSSFLQTWNFIVPLLECQLSRLQMAIAGSPVRVLLRETSVYQELLRKFSVVGSNEIEVNNLRLEFGLLESELFQLLAKDVPYYFVTRLNPTDLSYFSSSSKISHCDPGRFSPILRAATDSIANLCNERRLAQIQKVTALQIVRSFEGLWKRNCLKADQFSLAIDEGQFLLKTDSFNASAKW